MAETKPRTGIDEPTPAPFFIDLAAVMAGGATVTGGWVAKRVRVETTDGRELDIEPPVASAPGEGIPLGPVQVVVVQLFAGHAPEARLTTAEIAALTKVPTGTLKKSLADLSAKKVLVAHEREAGYVRGPRFEDAIL